MPKLEEVRERRHQPFFDTAFRGIGQGQGTNVINTVINLFGNANVGRRELTNLQTPGALASDSTYLIKALRVAMYFQGLADTEFLTFGTLPNYAAAVQGSNARAVDLYQMFAYGAFFSVSTADKEQIYAPLWYAPAGGGLLGSSTESNRAIVNNGMPTHQAILKLAKDIHLPARQSLSVNISLPAFSVLGNGQTAAMPNVLSIVDALNQFDGIKLLQFHIDGIQTRDVL